MRIAIKNMFSEENFKLLIMDDSKEILGNINWEKDKNHLGSFIFLEEIISSINYPISIKGSFNFKRRILSFSIIHREVGRIYGLDMGQTHKNRATGKKSGRIHKHIWTDLYKDQYTYDPLDITEPFHNVIGVWRQFCLEARIKHEGEVLGLPDYLQFKIF